MSPFFVNRHPTGNGDVRDGVHVHDDVRAHDGVRAHDVQLGAAKCQGPSAPPQLTMEP